MTQRVSEKVVRQHLWVYERDLERMKRAFPRQKPSAIVREMIRKFLNHMDAEAEAGRKAPLIMKDPFDAI